MTTYQEAAAALAASSAAATVGAWQVLPPALFPGLAATLVARFNLRAVALADAALAALVRGLPLGIGRSDDDEERLMKSFTTLTSDIAELPAEEAVTHVERIGRAEPLRAGQVAYGEALAAHAAGITVGLEHAVRRPIGWRRGLNPDACELCRWWARGGYVFAPEQGMRTHPQCSCVQVPAFDHETFVTQMASTPGDLRGAPDDGNARSGL